MKISIFFTLFVSFSAMVRSSFCIAGEVPTPRQEIKYDASGPYKDLIGLWTGNLSPSQETRNYEFQRRNAANWDFKLYVTSVKDKDASGIYCWSVIGKIPADCRELKGTVDLVEDKLIFQWSERTLTLLHKEKVPDYHKVTYRRVGGEQFEGLAKKIEKQ